MNGTQKYYRQKWEAVFRRLPLLLASPHPGQNSHAFVVGIWYVASQEQVRWNWILSNSSLESGTLQCWVAFYCWTLNVVWKELFFTVDRGSFTCTLLKINKVVRLRGWCAERTVTWSLVCGREGTDPSLAPSHARPSHTRLQHTLPHYATL